MSQDEFDEAINDACWDLLEMYDEELFWQILIGKPIYLK